MTCSADAADLCLKPGLDPDLLQAAFGVQAQRNMLALATTRRFTPQMPESNDDADDEEDTVITPFRRHLVPACRAHVANSQKEQRTSSNIRFKHYKHPRSRNQTTNS